MGQHIFKKAGKDYKKNMGKMIIDEVEKQNWIKPIGRFVYMDEVVYMPRVGRDPDNLKKLQQDAITESGVVWCDDSLALPRTNNLFIDKYNPRIEILLTVAPFMGVFDNQKHLQEFEDKCKTCRRYNNNCSILRKAKENRIQKEVKDFECNEYNERKS